MKKLIGKNLTKKFLINSRFKAIYIIDQRKAFYRQRTLKSGCVGK